VSCRCRRCRAGSGTSARLERRLKTIHSRKIMAAKRAPARVPYTVRRKDRSMNCAGVDGGKEEVGGGERRFGGWRDACGGALARETTRPRSCVFREEAARDQVAPHLVPLVVDEQVLVHGGPRGWARALGRKLTKRALCDRGSGEGALLVPSCKLDA